MTTRIKYALFLALVAMYWSTPLFEVRFIIREYHYRCYHRRHRHHERHERHQRHRHHRQLPASGLWPLSWFFGFPGHQAGSVGVLAGVLVASQGSSRFVGLLLPAK